MLDNVLEMNRGIQEEGLARAGDGMLKFDEAAYAEGGDSEYREDDSRAQ